MKSKPFLLLLACLFPLLLWGKTASENLFSAEKVAELPLVNSFSRNPGIAGAFSGITGDKLIIAGGTNFPDQKPWEGGIKEFQDRIYIYTINDDGICMVDGYWALPNRMAYGASVSLPEGVLCIGGNDRDQCFRSVYLLKWNTAHNDLDIESFPQLPIELSYASAVVIGHDIYLIGGSSVASAQDTGAHFLKLDLSKRNTINFDWEILPSFPGGGRVFAPTVVQTNGIRPCIYLFSGRNVTKYSGIKIFQDGMVYDPALKNWEILPETEQFPVMAGTAFAVGTSGIAFAGGASGDLLLQEMDLKKQLSNSIGTRDTALINQSKNQLIRYFTHHPGFSKEILYYNTITHKLIRAGKFESFCPVTTNIIPYKNGAILTSGETRPGIRTSDIFQISPVQPSFQFGIANGIILTLYFIFMIVIGFRISKKQKSTHDYFKGGNRIPWWAAGISLFGSALSAVILIATLPLSYTTDWTYFLFFMSILLAAPAIALLFVPLYRKLNVTTAYEYLEKRFNLSVRLLGSISFILFHLGRIIVMLLLPSLALSLVTGTDVFTCILITGIISLIYTLVGGIEAVIWNDVIQVVVLLLGALFVVFFMSNAIDGGFSGIIQTAEESHKMNMLNLGFSLREPTFWVLLLGGLFSNIAFFGTDQTMVQRYLTTKNKKQARKSIWTSTGLIVVATVLFFFIGTALFVFYRQFPELENSSITNPDSIFPWYIISQLPQGLSGLLIAGIFAATMSSLSGSMNSIATVYSTDIHFRFSSNYGFSKLKIARTATLITGLVGILIALFLTNINIQLLWIEFCRLFGLITGIIGGIFMLGMLTRKANSEGALIGIIISVIIQIVIARTGVVHLLLYTVTGFISCFVFGYLASFLFRNNFKSISGLTVFDLKKMK